MNVSHMEYYCKKKEINVMNPSTSEGQTNSEVFAAY